MHSAERGARDRSFRGCDAATIGAVVRNRFFTSAGTFDNHANAR